MTPAAAGRLISGDALEDVVAAMAGPATEGQDGAWRQYVRSIVYGAAQDENGRIIRAMREGRYRDLAPDMAVDVSRHHLDQASRDLNDQAAEAETTYGLSRSLAAPSAGPAEPEGADAAPAPPPTDAEVQILAAIGNQVLRPDDPEARAEAERAQAAHEALKRTDPDAAKALEAKIGPFLASMAKRQAGDTGTVGENETALEGLARQTGSDDIVPVADKSPADGEDLGTPEPEQGADAKALWTLEEAFQQMSTGDTDPGYTADDLIRFGDAPNAPVLRGDLLDLALAVTNAAPEQVEDLRSQIRERLDRGEMTEIQAGSLEAALNDVSEYGSFIGGDMTTEERNSALKSLVEGLNETPRLRGRAISRFVEILDVIQGFRGRGNPNVLGMTPGGGKSGRGSGDPHRREADRPTPPPPKKTEVWPTLKTDTYTVNPNGRMTFPQSPGQPARTPVQLAPPSQFEGGADGKIYRTYMDTVASGVPKGFKDRAEVAATVGRMQEKLQSAGIGHARIGMRGSAVTGHRFDKTTKRSESAEFGSGKRGSDQDYVIVSPDLFDRLKRKGISLRGNGTRTEPIDNDMLRRIGLDGLIPQRRGNKTNSIVVFQNEGTMTSQGRPYMWIDR